MDVNMLDLIIAVMIVVVILQRLYILRLKHDEDSLKFRRDELRLHFFNRSKRGQ